MISIEELMTTELFTLSPGDSIYKARMLMREKGIRHIPVVGDDGELVGLITQSDLLAASASPLRSTDVDERVELEREHPVSEAMTTHMATIDERDSLRAAAMHLLKNKHGCLPVMCDGKLKGIITDSDFVTAAVHLMEMLEQQELVPEDDEF